MPHILLLWLVGCFLGHRIQKTPNACKHRPSKIYLLQSRTVICTRLNLAFHFAGEPQIDEARQTKLLTAPRYNSPKSAPIPHIILTRASTKRKHHNTPGRGGKDDTKAKKMLLLSHGKCQCSDSK